MKDSLEIKKRPVALIVLSGFGRSHDEKHNAIAQAYTPFLDQYFSKYRHTLLDASGERVGLPDYQAGNSEVSHLIMGSGQTMPLDITRIDEAIRTGKFFQNPALIAAIDAAKRSALHLMGLVSDGGVHSMITHLYALLRMAAERGVERVFVHAFADGRDTAPTSARGYVAELLAKMRELGVGRIASLCGRYFAMDRDNRWDRIERAYRAIVGGEGHKASDPVAAIEHAHEHGFADEFIEPVVFTHEDGAPVATVRPGDSVVFFNFRADRARQLTRAFTGLNFDRFERERIQDLHFATFTQYDRSVATPIVFPPLELKGTLAEVFAENGISNLRIAETERYAHITYFFNGGIEKEFLNESRLLIPSPQVATYDLKPEMSAFRVTDKICRALDEGENDVYIINFANGDMVGHTGNLPAAVKAVEAVDTCLGWVIGAIERVKGAAIVTADHGNCEQMTDPDTGSPHTAHTRNPVPFILCDAEFRGSLREGGSLEDVAPTMLELLGIEKPGEMTGRSLLAGS
ncbi:MAG: 2,3-bisphosphoglycerate-independent phosphoglycerate mutase [Blastocatellia bacterium]